MRKLIKFFFGVLTLILANSAFASVILPAGMQTNVTQATVDSWGWSECHRSGTNTYVSQASVHSACSGEYVAMAIWDADESNYGVVAAALAGSVLSYNAITYQDDDSVSGPFGTYDNGVYWYQTSGSGSWGFSTTGQTALHTADVNLDNGINQYDSYGVQETIAAAGLSFHVRGAGLSGGWAWNETGYDHEYMHTRDSRVFWAFDVESVPEPSVIALFAAGLFGIGVARVRKA